MEKLGFVQTDPRFQGGFIPGHAGRRPMGNTKRARPRAAYL